MLRSHGMVRESTSEKIKAQYLADNDSLHKGFIFAFPAYNVRNTELGALLGISRLADLNENNPIRNQNHKIFFG